MYVEGQHITGVELSADQPRIVSGTNAGLYMFFVYIKAVDEYGDAYTIPMTIRASTSGLHPEIYTEVRERSYRDFRRVRAYAEDILLDSGITGLYDSKTLWLDDTPDSRRTDVATRAGVEHKKPRIVPKHMVTRALEAYVDAVVLEQATKERATYWRVDDEYFLDHPDYPVTNIKDFRYDDTMGLYPKQLMEGYDAS